MSFDVVLDVPREGDLVTDYGDVKIVVDRSSSIYIDEGMKLDFVQEQQKYKMISPNQILTTLYSLKKHKPISNEAKRAVQ